MQSLGIHIGSSSVKLVCMDNENILWSVVEPHEGNFIMTLKKFCLIRMLLAASRRSLPEQKEEIFFKSKIS